MFRITTTLTLSLFLAAGVGACGDNNDATPDASVGTVDAALTPDATDTPDAAAGDPDAMVEAPDAAQPLPDAMTTDTSTQIANARAAADGAVSQAIDGALVTFTKPAIGNDVAGFFVQAAPTGPALFVAVDPASLSPVPAIGDTVSFTVTEMGTTFTLREATAISDFTVQASGADVSPLVQDVTTATDVVSALTDYESELISLTGTITGDFGFAGTGHSSANIGTAGVPDGDMKLRMPEELVDALDLAAGCTFSTSGTPMWRFNDQAQPSIWTTADISVGACPAPRLVGAVASATTEVLLTFDRTILPASVLADGSQFTIDNGLAVSAATVDGKTVTLTTAAQTGATYTVTVADTVQDTLGAGVAADGNTATFNGFVVPAVVRINEVNGNISNGCDLMELRVISGGQMAGITVQERGSDIYTFPSMTVAPGDFIVLHWDKNDTGNCNTSDAADETVNKNDQPQADHPSNFDNAFDVWSTDSGMTATDNVLGVLDATGAFLDAVFVDDANDAGPANSTESAAATVATAGQWQLVGGGQPPGGFVDAVFWANAATDLDGTGSDAAGETIQRNDDDDNNDVADWVQAAPSWGALNAGQAPL